MMRRSIIRNYFCCGQRYLQQQQQQKSIIIDNNRSPVLAFKSVYCWHSSPHTFILERYIIKTAIMAINFIENDFM